MAIVSPDQRLIVSSRLDDLTRMVQVYRGRRDDVAFDAETTGLDPKTGYLVTLQFQQQGVASVAVFDVRHLPLELVGDVLAPLFDGSVLVIGHNLKFDLAWLMEKYGIYPARVFDTLIAEQVIHGLGRSDAKAKGLGLKLKDLTKRYLDREMSKEERNYFIDLDQTPAWNQPLPREQLEYAAEDVRVLHPIYQEQYSQFYEKNLVDVARLEMRTLPALALMELSGVKVDVAGWREFIQEKETEAQQIESQALEVFGAAILSARTRVYDEKLAVYQAWETARHDHEDILKQLYLVREAEDVKWGSFKIEGMKQWRAEHPNPGKPKPDTSLPNLSSPAQLLQAFTEMGIPAPSTASEVLERLEDNYPAIKLLLDYRKAEKFVTSFGEALLQYVDSEGRIHPEYVQIGASTGRMSCTRPNWQQVPSKGDGKRLRQLVVAPPGYKLLTADFSNIELRILADLSRDKTMLRLFSEGKDLHSETARMMFGLDDSVDVEATLLPGSDQTYRAVAKTINFGLVYGMSCVKLARTVHVSKERAQELMDHYFLLYPGVVKWLEDQRTGVKRTARSVTLSGRKRFYSVPPKPSYPRNGNIIEIEKWKSAMSEWRGVMGRIERQAMNSPIQGTSADMTKLALALLYERGVIGQQVAKLVAVVHDEIVLECPDGVTKGVAEQLASAMGDAARTYLHHVTVPPVKVSIEQYWSKA